MFDNLTVRNKFLASAAVPVNVLAVLALWSAVTGGVSMAVLAVVGALLTLVVASITARGVSERLEGLLDNTEQLGSVRLSAILSELTDPPAPKRRPDPWDTPLSDHRPDELGRLSRALDDLERQTRELVDRERETMSKDLGALVRSLARRNQSLLDRQIEHLDWLEANEDDPARLEQLFKLDHLATRMRRASESILVLGGAEPPRPRGGPARMVDVLRVAIGETEHYHKVRLHTVDEVMVAAGPAFDLAHLMAEVLENATQFSSPESLVELYATRAEDGLFRITVIDRGIGMEQRLLDAANAIIAEPPLIDLTMGHSTGFVVIGRLAQRLGASVSLSATTSGPGVTVEVSVPASVLVEPTGRGRDPEPAATGDGAPAARWLTPVEPDEERVPAGLPEPTHAPVPDSPLGKLLGLSADDLPASAGWTPAVTDTSGAGPLRSRESATTRLPDGDPVERPAVAEPATAAFQEAPTPQPGDAGWPQRAGNDMLAALMGLRRSQSQEQPEDPAPTSPTPGGLAANPGDGARWIPKFGGSQASEVEEGGEAAPWTPKEPLTPPAPDHLPVAPLRPAITLAEAIPTGAAFDTGVDALLDREPREATGTAGSTPPTVDAGDGDAWIPPTVADVAGIGGHPLASRDRAATPAGPSALEATAVPAGGAGRTARATERTPELKRSTLESFRKGIRGGGDEPSESVVPMAPWPASSADPLPSNTEEGR